MQYNQFVQITGSNPQKSITLRPPPILISQPSSKDLKSKQRKQLKPIKQSTKQTPSTLQHKLFQTEAPDKTHRNLQQIIKSKLRVSEYTSTPNNQLNHGLLSKIGSKKLHKKKDRIRQIVLTKQEEKVNSIKRIDKLLVNSEYDEFINHHIQDRNLFNPDTADTRINFASSMEKSKEYQFNYNKFRSSSVIAFSQSSNHKRIKLVLKSSTRNTNQFQHPMIKNSGSNNKSQSRLDHTLHYDQYRVRYQRQIQESRRQDRMTEKQKNCEFQIKKRILQKITPRKLDKKLTSSSKINMDRDMDIECIDAWKNKQQLNQNSTNRLQQIETQENENEIIEFVERQIHLS